jgi:hypothetical protein
VYPGATSPTGAVFSPDRRHRYHLWRVWNAFLPRVMFVGVNPSTADETADDATIRKCCGFARRWGGGALDMVNLFSLVSTDVRAVLSPTDHPMAAAENRVAIAMAMSGTSRIVLAWGRHPPRVQAQIRARVFGPPWSAITTDPRAGTLGHNADGSPRHPLMLPYTTAFEPGPP